MIIQAQTFVSTTPSNKNVVAEEITGKDCPSCPSGHATFNQIVATNPERIFVINIHETSYANGTPNYKSPFGLAIFQAAWQGASTIYVPSATINRHNFLGTTWMAMTNDAPANNWATYSNQVLAQPSCVNVAARSTIDFETRELTVTVEAYYTGNSTASTNKLNVALLQNNILGPQSGMSSNPSQVINGQYKHMHMLRHLLTGQWGETISTTTTGSFVEREFTYTIPAHLNNVEYALEDLDVIVFIAEGNAEIITGAKSEMTFLNAKPKISALKEREILNCSEVGADVEVKNLFEEPLTSFTLSYTYSGNTETFEWSETAIPSGGSTTVSIPAIEISGTSLPLSVTLVEANDVAINDVKNITLSKSVVNAAGNITFVLNTDAYASETSFKIYGPSGSVILSGGPWPNLQSAGTTRREFEINPTEIGCYRLEVLDSYGDGINTGYGAGSFQILSSEGAILHSNNGKFGSKATVFIDVEALAPAKPENLQITSTGCNHTMTWDHPAGVANPTYNIYKNNVLITNQSSNSYTFTTESGETFNWCVQTVVDGVTSVKVCKDNVSCGTGINGNTSENIVIAPNPASDIVNISGINPTKIEIFNTYGQLVISKIDNLHSIDISSLNNGIYLFKIYNSDNESVTKKMVIAR